MKKLIYSLVTINVLLFSLSCKKAKKNYDEYLPKVTILSATIQTDGSVLVVGELESDGEASISRIGFCCGSGSNNSPKMLDRQIICTLADNTFTTSYPQLSADSAYHFRAWATNKYGYSYSEVITLDSIVVPPVIAPCTITNETVSTGTTFGNGTFYGSPHPVVWSASYSAYNISPSTSSGYIGLNIYLNLPLSQGMYTTTGSSYPGYREMYFTFIEGSNYYGLNPGSPVYVNTIGPGVFDVTVCDAPWQFTTSTTLYFKTRFTAYNL